MLLGGKTSGGCLHQPETVANTVPGQLALCYMSLENCHRCQFYHHFEYDVPEPHYLRMNKLFRVFGLNLPSYNLQFSPLERLFAHVASLVV